MKRLVLPCIIIFLSLLSLVVKYGNSLEGIGFGYFNIPVMALCFGAIFWIFWSTIPIKGSYTMELEELELHDTDEMKERFEKYESTSATD